MGGEGIQHVCQVGLEDKKAITLCVLSAMNGLMLPLQIVFKGKTPRSMSKIVVANDSLNASFHWAMSNKQWSNLETCKQFGNHDILVPYMRKDIDKIELSRIMKN